MVVEQRTFLHTSGCVVQSCVAGNEVDWPSGSTMLSHSTGERRLWQDQDWERLRGLQRRRVCSRIWNRSSAHGECPPRSPPLGRMDLTCLRDVCCRLSISREVSTMGQYYESTSAGRWEKLHPNVMLSGGTNILTGSDERMRKELTTRVSAVGSGKRRPRNTEAAQKNAVCKNGVEMIVDAHTCTQHNECSIFCCLSFFEMHCNLFPSAPLFFHPCLSPPLLPYVFLSPSFPSFLSFSSFSPFLRLSLFISFS